jgi:hypothetical protein
MPCHLALMQKQDLAIEQNLNFIAQVLPPPCHVISSLILHLTSRHVLISISGRIPGWTSECWASSLVHATITSLVSGLLLVLMQ